MCRTAALLLLASAALSHAEGQIPTLLSRNKMREMSDQMVSAADQMTRMSEQGAPDLGKATEQMTNAFHQIQTDVAENIQDARDGKRSKHKKVESEDKNDGWEVHDEPHSANLKADHWKECGEPIAYWGDGNDRTQCPCKPDPSKAAVKDTIPQRLELLEKSPEHQWKVNASTDVHWKGQFYVNLALSTKRRDFIEMQLKEIGGKHKGHRIPTHRWAATDPHQAARANLKEFSDEGLHDYVKNMGDREKWGTIGTYMSHLRLLRKIWTQDKNGEGLYVIMEDDGTLDDKWQKKVELAFKNGDIPKDWDMIKFGYWGLVRCEDQVSGGAYEARTPMMLTDGTRKSFYNGNLGYIVRPKSIPAILAAIRKKPVFDVDGVFVDLNTQENATSADYGIHTYYLKHSLVKGGTGGQLLGTDRLGGSNTKYSLQQEEEETN